MYNHQSESKFLASAPPLLTSWLKEEGSLTDRLNQMTHAAQLHVVHQEWIRAGWWEKYVLHYQNGSLWQREILMLCHGHICWYAKTLVDESVFLRHRDFFSKVEQASLNQLLFREHKAHRQSKVLGSFTSDAVEFHWVKQALAQLTSNTQQEQTASQTCFADDITLWGRRSSFAIDAQSTFYLVEIFLPGLLDAIACA